MGNLVFQATLGGQVNLVGPNTASTFNINVPTVNGNMVTTGDTGTVTNTMCATSVYTAPGTIGSGTPNTGAFTTLTTTSTINNLTVGRGAGAVSTNTAVGASALGANTTGARNTVVGAAAGATMSTASAVTAVGYGALNVNTGDANTGIGEYSLQATTSGAYNTALGYRSLYSNTTASNNTAVGYQAAYSNTTASRNTAIGYQAGYSNTTGHVTAIGSYTLKDNTTGTGNTAVGGNDEGIEAALQHNTTGSYNIAVGTGALVSNNTGSYGTSVGYQALTSNTTASSNTAVGYQTGYSNTTGTYNVFVGSQAGYTNSTGSSNTFVGEYAGFATTGQANTFIGCATGGYGAGYQVTSGSKNTILGGYGGNQGGLDIRTASNYIVLSDGDGNPRMAYAGTEWRMYATDATGRHVDFDGNEFFPVPDNVVKLGYPSYRWTTVYATTGTINTSDINQKQDIAALDDAEKRVATAIKSLIKKYRFRDAVAEKGDAARIHVGAVAQEVQAAFVAEGLDPARYALFCSDTWYEVDGRAKADDGNFYTAETEGAVEVTRLGLRYDELLAFVIAAM